MSAHMLANKEVAHLDRKLTFVSPETIEDHVRDAKAGIMVPDRELAGPELREEGIHSAIR